MFAKLCKASVNILKEVAGSRLEKPAIWSWTASGLANNPYIETKVAIAGIDGRHGVESNARSYQHQVIAPDPQDDILGNLKQRLDFHLSRLWEVEGKLAVARQILPPDVIRALQVCFKVG